jgi:hypothetical protein
MAPRFLKQPLIVLLGVSLALNALLWVAAVVVFPRTSPAAVLHYSIDVGIDFIGEGKQIIVLPAVGLAMAVGNALLGWLLRRTDPGAAYIAWGMAPAAQIVLLAAFILIWRANL